MKSNQAGHPGQRTFRNETMRSPDSDAASTLRVSSTPPSTSVLRTNRVPMRRRNGPATRCPASSSLATKEGGPGITDRVSESDIGQTAGYGVDVGH